MDEEKVEVGADSAVDVIPQNIVPTSSAKRVLLVFICFGSVWSGTFPTLAIEYLGDVK